MDEVEIDRFWHDPEFRKQLKYIEQASLKNSDVNLDEKLIGTVLSGMKERFSSRSLGGDLGKKIDLTLARNIRHRYSKTPLSTEGNSYSNGRFHRKGIKNPTLYLAESEQIASSERSITGFKAVKPHTSFWVNLQLQNVLDLTQPQKQLFVDDEEKQLILSLPYLYFNDILDVDAPSQIVAKKARMEGYEGVLYPSVRGEGVCLAIFCDHLLLGSKLSVVGKDDFYGVSNEELEIIGFI